MQKSDENRIRFRSLRTVSGQIEQENQEYFEYIFTEIDGIQSSKFRIPAGGDLLRVHAKYHTYENL